MSLGKPHGCRHIAVGRDKVLYDIIIYIHASKGNAIINKPDNPGAPVNYLMTIFLP